MKKRTKHLVIFGIMAILMIASIVIATLIGSGNIDMSYTIKNTFICIAVICGIISCVALRGARKE